MKIAPDDAFDADSFDKPVIGIASEMGVHDSGRHSHLRHQLLYSAAGSITIEVADDEDGCAVLNRVRPS
ncbi:MAG: hypothetical protein E7J44_18870, partial [Citrobacter freundii]|nr:hypothetical protein [Citrobacter freundii]